MRTRHRYQPTLEPLEGRRVLASVWQNANNPLDVDRSGFVAALDVLHIANDINHSGVRQLGNALPSAYSGPLCDTSGDGRLSGLDALLVVNAINQFPDPLALNVRLTTQSDGNGDGVVLRDSIEYQGQANPNVQVKIESLSAGATEFKASGQANQDGSFNLPVSLTQPITQLRITATDPRGRVLSTERLVRRGDAVSAWNAALLETVRESTSPSTTVPGLMIKPPPPMVARSLAMVHGALFDAINAIDQRYQGYLTDNTVHPDASAIAAGATAAYRVAANLFDSSHAMTLWDQTLAEIMATVPEGSAKSAGIDLGKQIADSMLALRANDGSANPSPYTPGTEPGQWRPSAPGFSPATLPQWPGVTPFVMQSGQQFRPASPPALDSSEYATAVDQVTRLGSLNSAERTAEQTNIAKFWADAGGTSTPPGHWNQIAIDIGLTQGLSLVDNARLMALMNYSLADAGLASWDAKYAYNLWRPIDAIRLADTDGNPNTTQNAAWAPLLNTPSFPSYTSGHSTFSAAAATVLSDLFGENFAFATRADRGSSGVWPPSDDIANLAVRQFSSFQQAADEAGLSRIYGGIHFSFDNTAGQQAGRQIGQLVVDSLLAPR